MAVTYNLDIGDHTLLLTNKELESGRLTTASVVKVGCISSMEQTLARKKIGRITKHTFESIINEMAQILGVDLSAVRRVQVRFQRRVGSHLM